MKTFAAAALAASVSAFDAESVPEFIAGFMYGMTGYNHLTEIEACYTGGQQVVTDSQKAFSEARSGDYFRGIADAGKAWNEIGSAMTTCQGMDNDIAAIEAWAQIFTQPEVLSKTVAKHWLLHRTTIKADIASEEADWASGDYFQAGVDTANALTEAVGPIENANSPMDYKPEVFFVSGFVEGFIGYNHLTEIGQCLTDGTDIVKDADIALIDLETGNITDFQARIQDALQVTSHLFGAEGDCFNLLRDVQAIQVWADRSTAQLEADEMKNLALHHKQAGEFTEAMTTDWASQKYYASGKAFAGLVTIALGPIEEEAPIDESYANYALGVDLLALPELAAGFVYGMVGDNHLTEMQTCYKSTTELGAYLELALQDLEAFQIFGAMKQFEEFVYHFQLDVAPCEQMQDDVAAIELWAQAFKTPESLVASATKHYLLHKRAITQDIATLKADWAAKSFFATGRTAADILTVLVGEIQ